MQPKCAKFAGYFPCAEQRRIKANSLITEGKYTFLKCNESCPHFQQAEPLTGSMLSIPFETDSQTPEEKILFVDIGGIGTAIRWEPTFSYLRELYPSHEIHFLGAEKSRGLFGEKGLIPGVIFHSPSDEELTTLSQVYWDQVYSIESGNTDIVEWVTRLRSEEKRGFVLDPVYGKVVTAGETQGELQLLNCQIDDEIRRWISKPFQQILMEVVTDTHQAPEAKMSVFLDPSLKSIAEAILTEAIPQDRRSLPLIGVNLSCASHHDAKEIPLETIRDIILNQPNKNFFLIWGPDDKARLEEFYALLGKNIPENLFFLEEVVSLQVLAWLVRLLDAAISTESMFSNLAIAVKDWDRLLIIACGPQPSREVDPQGKTVSILDKKLPCSPCFKGKKASCLLAGTDQHLACMKFNPMEIVQILQDALLPY